MDKSDNYERGNNYFKLKRDSESDVRTTFETSFEAENETTDLICGSFNINMGNKQNQ
jgi:hypothetical protein